MRDAISQLSNFLRTHAVIDSLIYRLSVYGVPLAAGIVTLIAALSWESQYPSGNSAPLEIRFVEDRLGNLEPSRALARLDGAPLARYADTGLSERPFWFSFTAQPSGEHTDIEFPSRHALTLACWKASGLKPLGQANRATTTGSFRASKAGFAMELGGLDSPTRILCASTSSGPARISVAQWRASEIRVSAGQFHRNSGLLEGGLVVLSAFALLTAIVTREKLYMLFAAWLLASLRLAAISAGWDTQWFEWRIPPEWIFETRKLSIALYVVLTYALFQRLFQDDLKRVDDHGLLRVNQLLSLVLLTAAAFISFSHFLPLLWLVVGVGVTVFIYLLARILWVTRSMVAVWYSVSFVIVLSTGLYEAIAAALGIKALIGVVNSVTGALPASLATALAIAEQIRLEREERLKAQEELKATYEAIPIGLFTLTDEGEFSRSNPAMQTMLGADPSAGQSTSWSDVFGAPLWAQMRQSLRAATTCEMELRGPGSGGTRWFSVKAALTADKIEGSLQDITERHDATERLRYLAENDALTGVLNRTGVERALSAAYARIPGGGSFALGYLDLDRFKLINDLFGHVAGDEVLRQVCGRARSMLAEPHKIGRVGGDEFVILFEDTTMKVATAICRSIVDLIGRNSYNIDEKAFQVKASIG
ncbi:MAG: diguanylate cyclase, partial [Betaproteobacteria bacterium]|nr:diguanylate cyclase [Betaproteobacteria bacterium]